MKTRTTIQAFFDPGTWTVTYVVWTTVHALRRNHRPRARLRLQVRAHRHRVGRPGDGLRAATRGCRCEWILETHAHADHLSGARVLAGAAWAGASPSASTSARCRRPSRSSSTWSATFLPGRQPVRPPVRGRRGVQDRRSRRPRPCWSRATRRRTWPTCGRRGVRRRHAVHAGRRHAPAPTSRAATRAPVSLDTPAAGRCRRETRDVRLPRLSARGPRSRSGETTVAEQRARNIHVRDGISEDEFVAMRKARDSTPRDADAHPAVDPGQCARRSVAAGRRQRRGLPSHPAEHASSAEVNPTLRTGSDSGLTSPSRRDSIRRASGYRIGEGKSHKS